MPAKLEPISKLNYAWPKGENDWNLGMDENLRRIGVLLQNGIESHTTQAPASPTVGKLYIVPPSATGAWAGKSGQIATWEPSAWFFVEPRDGMIMYNVNTKDILVYIGATWVSVVATDPTYAAFKAAYDTFVTSVNDWRSMGYVDTQVESDKRTPKWYLDTYGMCVKSEFYQTSFNGLNQGWGVVSTYVGHTSASSGYMKQVAICGAKIFLRQSTSDTAWGAWSECLRREDVGTAAFGTVTTSNKDSTPNAIMRIGDWGIARPTNSLLPVENLPLSTGGFPNCSFFRVQGGDSTGHGAGVGQAVGLQAGTYLMQYLQMGSLTNAHAMIFPMNIRHEMYHGTLTLNNGSTTVKRFFKFYDDANTTVDANGFLKVASPIVRLYADHIELNDDAAKQDITFERVDVGHYLVKGSSGFATDGWWLNVPVDSNGNKIVASTHRTLVDGTLEIKTFKRKFDIETATIVPDLDNPVDIPTNSIGESRWIDIRLIEIDLPQVEDYIPLDPDDDVTESVK